MGRSAPYIRAAVLLAVATVATSNAGCQPSTTAGLPHYTAADVQFMQGMIGHHAQAVTMAGWAPTHGARADVQILAGRIVVSQRDEIASMQRWLRDHHEMAPDANGHMTMDMGSGGHDALMPGMLTPEEMAQLDRARGPEFDKLFLAFMIHHHQGALTMVQQLFGTQGAAQDEVVFKFASDVGADQTAEIDRMVTMLGTLQSASQ